MSELLRRIYVTRYIRPTRAPRDEGQTTVEYALVLVAAAAIAALLIAWAARTGRIDALLDRAFDRVDAGL